MASLKLGKVGQDRARSGKVGQGRARSGKIGQGRARSGKVGQGRARSGKIGQGRARSGKVGQGRARSGKVGQGRARSGKVGQGRARSGKIGQDRATGAGVACTALAAPHRGAALASGVMVAVASKRLVIEAEFILSRSTRQHDRRRTLFHSTSAVFHPMENPSQRFAGAVEPISQLMGGVTDGRIGRGGRGGPRCGTAD
jgi:hypothetical protein